MTPAKGPLRRRIAVSAPLARLDEEQANRQEPKATVPTAEDLLEAAKIEFSILCRCIEKFDRVVKEKLGVDASVSITFRSAHSGNRFVNGSVEVLDVGTTTPAPKKNVPFRIKGGKIWIGGKKGGFPSERQRPSGALFSNQEQDNLAASLADVLLDFYRVGRNKQQGM
jgi:hypothetical protein